MERDLSFGKLYAVVNYPSQPERKRFYVDLLTSQGELIAFAKVSLDNENDKYLTNELKSIQRINKSSYSFKIPKVINRGLYQEHKYLIFEPIPCYGKKQNSISKSQIENYSEELAYGTNDILSLKELNWWHKFVDDLSIINKKEFLKYLEIESGLSINVCLAHGDLGRGNICSTRNKTWILDWEASSIKAPIMTDKVVSFLINNQRRIGKKPIYVAKELKKELVNQNISIKKDVALALIYLSTTGREDAKIMICHWKYIFQ